MTRKRETGNSPEVWPADGEVLAGLVERGTFHKEENGFCVLRVKARGHRGLATVGGYTAGISAGGGVGGRGGVSHARADGGEVRGRCLRAVGPAGGGGGG